MSKHQTRSQREASKRRHRRAMAIGRIFVYDELSMPLTSTLIRTLATGWRDMTMWPVLATRQDEVSGVGGRVPGGWQTRRVRNVVLWKGKSTWRGGR